MKFHKYVELKSSFQVFKKRLLKTFIEYMCHYKCKPAAF